MVAAGVDEFLGGGEIGLRANPFLRIFFLVEEGAGPAEMDVVAKSGEGLMKTARRLIGGMQWPLRERPGRGERNRCNSERCPVGWMSLGINEYPHELLRDVKDQRQRERISYECRTGHIFKIKEGVFK